MTIQFGITMNGGVLTTAKLNSKDTRVSLYHEDGTKPLEWTVVLEPLANSPDEAF